MRLLRFILPFATLASIGSLQADEEAGSAEKLVFKTDWKGERIELPPPFAPEMKLEGIEEIRFAPGMFEPESDSFFSYVFVFSVPGDQELSQEVIQKETLAYYRGLAASVLKGKGKEVDTTKFKFTLEKSDKAGAVPASVGDKASVTEYRGKLDWIEPFATAKPQVLHFEIQAWTDPKTERGYLFVNTSPKEVSDTAAIWKEMRTIRSEFRVEAASAK
ncbi:MAG: hypothetical protein ACR2RV_02930 [Verrucomicrobiales bacterium]